MFEQQYDDEMTAEILRLEGKQRAAAAGHPEWEDACPVCRRRVAVGAACEGCPGEAGSQASGAAGESGA